MRNDVLWQLVILSGFRNFLGFLLVLLLLHTILFSFYVFPPLSRGLWATLERLS